MNQLDILNNFFDCNCCQSDNGRCFSVVRFVFASFGANRTKLKRPILLLLLLLPAGVGTKVWIPVRIVVVVAVVAIESAPVLPKPKESSEAGSNPNVTFEQEQSAFNSTHSTLRCVVLRYVLAAVVLVQGREAILVEGVYCTTVPDRPGCRCRSGPVHREPCPFTGCGRWP